MVRGFSALQMVLTVIVVAALFGGVGAWVGSTQREVVTQIRYEPTPGTKTACSDALQRGITAIDRAVDMATDFAYGMVIDRGVDDASEAVGEYALQARVCADRLGVDPDLDYEFIPPPE